MRQGWIEDELRGLRCVLPEEVEVHAAERIIFLCLDDEERGAGSSPFWDRCVVPILWLILGMHLAEISLNLPPQESPKRRTPEVRSSNTIGQLTMGDSRTIPWSR